MKKALLIPALAIAVSASTNAAITYFDAPSGGSGTTITIDGITTTWEQYDTTTGGFITFDDSKAGDNGAANTNTGLWVHRTTGPAANAANTTAYQVADTVNAAQNRIVFTGLDAGQSYRFYFYSTAAGGAGGPR